MLLLRIDFLTGEDEDGLYPSKTLPATASFAPKSPDKKKKDQGDMEVRNLGCQRKAESRSLPPLFRSLVPFCFLFFRFFYFGIFQSGRSNYS